MLMIFPQTKRVKKLFLPPGEQNGKSKYEYSSLHVEKTFELIYKQRCIKFIILKKNFLFS